MNGVAWAADAGSIAGNFANISQFVPLILIFIVFYFLLIRPQQKKAKEHQNYLSNLKKGEKVITGGGIYGQITGLTDTVAVSYTHLRAHETDSYLVCRLLLEKK